MGEPIVLHDIIGRMVNVDDETVYEIPDISKEDDDNYMKIKTLAERMTTSRTTRYNQARNLDGVDVSKPENDTATLRKVQIVCGLLLMMLVVNSVTIGVLIHMLVSMTKLDK